MLRDGKVFILGGDELLIQFKHSGNFRNTEKFLKRVSRVNPISALNKYGEMGVQALASATPTDSGNTANSWSYQIEHNYGGYTVTWSNSNEHNGVNIAIILQFGHGTGTGGYVQGRDYINPAIQPVFDQMANDLFREVTG